MLYLWIATLLMFTSIGAVPLFNTLPLQEFETIDNFNLPLQPIRLFSAINPDDPPNPQPPRTNDFQALQQQFAQDRQIVRVNQFYVSQGPSGIGLTAANFQLADTQAITTPTHDLQLIFGAIQSQNLTRTTHLLSSQMLTVTYSLPQQVSQVLQVPPTQPNPPAVPELYLLYEGTAPLVRTNGRQIAQLFVDGVEVSLSRPLPAGRQFVVILESNEVWVIDVVQSALPILFVVENDRTVLRSTIPFVGLLRFGGAQGPITLSNYNEFQRNMVSPFLVTNGPTIDQIRIDGVSIDPAVFNPPAGQRTFPLPPGRSFHLILSSGEEWLLFSDPLLPPLEFVINAARTTFRATTFYNGNLRFASLGPGIDFNNQEALEVQTNSILFNPSSAISNSRAPPFTIRDYNVIGNAYHDIEYNQLTPQITLQGSATLARIFIDDIEQPLFSPDPFPAGRKFKFVFQRLAESGLLLEQSWLFYIEQSFQPPFTGADEGSLGADLIPLPLQLNFTTNALTLTASTPFTGIIRVAVVETTPKPNLAPTLIDPMVTDSWSRTAVTQTFPPTPISMYLLWPSSWTALLGAQMTTLIPQFFLVPSCALIAELLPTLALTDFRRAFAYFQQILPTQYFFTDNPFLTYFFMSLARELSNDISNYQSIFRPQPTYAITPSTTLTEAAYDLSRTAIPIAADVVFDKNAYHWNYSCINDAQNPLCVWPAYKQLNTVIHGPPIPGFAYLDPIKGTLLAARAVACKLHFLEGPTPPWYALSYIPPFLILNGHDLNLLQLLFSGLPFPSITTSTVTAVGKQIFEFALTATVAVFVYDQIKGLKNFIPFFTQMYIDVVKATLDSWLITHVDANGTPLPDFFIGDATTPGVCTISGMFARNGQVVNSLDEGNAIYNLHHRQYGWWLASVAMVIQWDDRFQIQDPWIAQQVTLANGERVKKKDFVDLLWRDACNVDKDDPDTLPFNRHGNPWEGHSTDTGLLYHPLAQGRSAESWAEDFNAWVGTNQYAQAVLVTPALDATDKAGFDLLQTFSQTNMQLTATSGKLVYKDNNWIYTLPYGINVTVGTVFDSATTVTTTLQAGSPSCELYTPP